jgi:hypothetical protein
MRNEAYLPVKFYGRWSCSDFLDHSHKWWFTAWICGKWAEWLDGRS